MGSCPDTHIDPHFLGAYKENLFNNQELPLLVIIFFILVTLMCDSGVIQQGQIRSLSLLGCKGLIWLPPPVTLCR